MTPQKDVLDRLRIASPCSVGWENMTGDERVRFCDQCHLHVYNISEMTRAEVQSLVASTEGRICARMYRRADGTVLTSDCPVGLRALRRRVSKMAGAALTALLSLYSGAFGQAKPQEDKTCGKAIVLQTKKSDTKDERRTVHGVVMDITGAVVAGAKVSLIDEETGKRLTAVSTDKGVFKFSNLMAGKYSLLVGAKGLQPAMLKHLSLNAEEVVQATVTLNFKGETTIGVLVSTPDIESSNGTTVFRGEAIQRLPLPK